MSVKMLKSHSFASMGSRNFGLVRWSRARSFPEKYPLALRTFNIPLLNDCLLYGFTFCIVETYLSKVLNSDMTAWAFWFSRKKATITASELELSRVFRSMFEHFKYA